MSMTTTPSGLQYEDNTTGSGDTAKAGQQVTVHYTGWLYQDGQQGKKFRFEPGPQRPVQVLARRCAK